ncbi:subtilisin-like protease [Pluteus cervinus]|uniref:Subtilisin-like protease n=1 Tax=Pluteus cervinus TaxID=181527 RepID=A0ACD3AKS8_9AGAR|nr:subtilisin-like protease [Pluteus cervinus]
MKLPNFVWTILSSSVFLRSAFADPNGLGYIVELDPTFNPFGRRGLSGLHHDATLQELHNRGIPFTVQTTFNVPEIFVGFALSLLSANDVLKILDIPSILYIRPITRIPQPKLLEENEVQSADAQTIPRSRSTLIMAGVDKVHAQGNFGQGIKIGIIDTGIDYTHPLLGGGFGPGFKVAGGYDFVGDAYNGSNQLVPDNDPLDQCNGHGTHVAGIVGASGPNPLGLVGVASEASLWAYRVFGCEGSVTDDVIVSALLRAYQDDVDIVTLSLGGPDGWSQGTAAVVASRIAAEGKVVTIAAGNDGDSGAWFTSNPSNGVNVISVASVNSIGYPSQNATVNGVQHDPIPYLQALPFNALGKWPIYATSTNTSVADDACDPLPDDTPDLSKYVVVVRRGSCTFGQKLDNLASKGANMTLIYNSDDGAWVVLGDGAAMISAADGKFLVDQFANNASVTLTFPQSGAWFDIPIEDGGLISDFSNYGPTFEMDFKPAVAAPGGNILSTIPNNQYFVASGTSMATPFVAGSAALILNARGNTKDVALGMRDLLETTAVGVTASDDGTDTLQTLSQQGSGLLQVDRAISTKTLVSPGHLTLNDTEHRVETHIISIKNDGGSPTTYRLGHTPAGTANSVQPGSIFAAQGPVPLTTESARVHIVPDTILVLPGTTTRVSVTIDEPVGLDTSQYPVYSGFITITSSYNETLKVSYLGVVGNLRDKTILDDTADYFGVQMPAILEIGQGLENTTQGPDFTIEPTDYPRLLYRLAFGTARLRFDLVDKDTTLLPESQSHRKRSLPSWIWPVTKPDTFDLVPIIGVIEERDYIPRHSDLTTDSPLISFNYEVLGLRTFVNNTAMPNGQYRVLVRALTVFGDPDLQEDQESWLSPVFTIDSS